MRSKCLSKQPDSIIVSKSLLLSQEEARVQRLQTENEWKLQVGGSPSAQWQNKRIMLHLTLSVRQRLSGLHTPGSSLNTILIRSSPPLQKFKKVVPIQPSKSAKSKSSGMIRFKNFECKLDLGSRSPE